MRLIDCFKVFAFLAFIGSIFLSTVFNYPIFTMFWFGIMVLLMIPLSKESSILTILAFTALAYIPLGLIYALSDFVSHTVNRDGTSQFGWLLFTFIVIELIFALVWLDKKH